MGDSDLTDLRKQCLSSLYSCTENISKYLDTERYDEYKKMKSYVKEYCIMEAQQHVAIQALEKAKQEIDASIIDTLNSKFESYLASMVGININSDSHPYMLGFHKRVKQLLEPANNLEDSDVAITASQTTYNDPFTKTVIKDPVRNTLCSHIYEKEVIMNIIETKGKNGIKCPVAGCGNRELIKPSHLISDEELKFRMTITQNSTMIQDQSNIELD